ncbi:response regulator transcription factor [Baekduia sp. Peel2402]|uniref:response regulator transcription factor n=1 Tax=Baekduia sp. Peel2402 TaxID=3458296 RepID=UPI00403EE9C5
MGDSAGICEDDETLRTMMQRALEQAGFTVRTTATGAAALAAFTDDPPDVLILDIGLPDADGRDVCRSLRAHGVRTPVLLLATGDVAAEQMAAAEAGGDDCLAKPFPLAALLVRIGRLTQLRAHDAPRLDRSARAIVAGDVRAALTPTEFRILVLLTDRRGQVVTRAELVAAGWPSGATVTDNTLDAYVARLRRKLRAVGAVEAIRTCRGLGYELR